MKSIMQAQSMSLTFTHVFAALVAVVNSKVSQTRTCCMNAFDLKFYILV